MITDQTKVKIEDIWDNYVGSSKIIKDTKGNPINDIDKQRLIAIEELRSLINEFQIKKIDIIQFKRTLK